jgi:hypothetical protein
VRKSLRRLKRKQGSVLNSAVRTIGENITQKKAEDEMTDETIGLFVSKDNLRPKMLKPFIWNGYTCATDGICFILIGYCVGRCHKSEDK